MGGRELMPTDEPAESVTDWNSNSTTYSYDDAGRMTTATLPRRSQKSYQYDVYGEVTGGCRTRRRARHRPPLAARRSPLAARP